LTSKGSRLVAVVLVALVVAAGLGYSLLAPKTPSQLVTLTTYTTERTSLSASSEQTRSTVSLSTTIASETTLWINVTATKPVSYYLGLLEANGTQPYVQLARELRRLPELTNATAVAKITYLALNATNPEVREAFELMMRGGTPDPKDFSYPVPRYNTELEVLYWLASSTQLKQEDTLALAIAMVNGLWVTMGNEQVREAVKKDTSDLLVFLRETNEMQHALAHHQLENYPLEAKIALAWTGGLSMHWIGPLTQPKVPMRLEYYKTQRLPMVVYEKDTVSVRTLGEMRKIANERGWWVEGSAKSVGFIERFFYFTDHGRNWEYVNPPQLNLDDNGLDAELDIDWQFNRFVNGSPPRGDCMTEATWVNAWAKSIGIATVLHWMYRLGQPAGSKFWYSHHYAIYFDSSRQVWTADANQLLKTIPDDPQYKEYQMRYFVFRPPVDQVGYLDYRIGWTGDVPDYYYRKLAYCFTEISFGQAQSMMLSGVQMSQMKQWLLYS